jgi:ribosomal protein S18 acetylase RimI-like enzyme
VSAARLHGAEVAVRAIAAADQAAVHELIAAELVRNPYAERALRLVNQVGAEGPYQGIVAEHGGRVVGVGVFGLMSGSSGAGTMYAAAVEPAYRRLGVGRALLERAASMLGAQGARFVLVEVPDDPAASAGFVALLQDAGFSEAARIPDLYRDGVALAFWRRVL